MAYLTQYSSSVPVIKYNIDQTLMTIGQNLDMDICVPEEGIADDHAVVEAIKSADSYCFIMKSTENESLIELNGKSVSSAELHDGDWVMIGEVEFQFTDDGVNEIVEDSVKTSVQNIESKPKNDENTEKSDSEALNLIKDLKEELQDFNKPLTTKEFIANSRMSRRRLAI